MPFLASVWKSERFRKKTIVPGHVLAPACLAGSCSCHFPVTLAPGCCHSLQPLLLSLKSWRFLFAVNMFPDHLFPNDLVLYPTPATSSHVPALILVITNPFNPTTISIFRIPLSRSASYPSSLLPLEHEFQPSWTPPDPPIH